MSYYLEWQMEQFEKRLQEVIDQGHDAPLAPIDGRNIYGALQGALVRQAKLIGWSDEEVLASLKQALQALRPSTETQPTTEDDLSWL